MKLRLPVAGTVGKSIAFSPNATPGATIGVDLKLADGSIATVAKLQQLLGLRSSSGSSGLSHGSLTDLQEGDDHPQYTMYSQLETIIAPWVFKGAGRGLDILSNEPRLRLIESDAAANGGLWDHRIDGGVYAIRTRNDADNAGANLLELTRTGTTATLANFPTTGLQHAGSQVITEAGAGLTKTFNTLDPNDFTITLGTDLSGAVTITNLSSAALASTIVANAVTDTKLRDSAALSIIGRASNSAGDPADIAAGADDTLLRRTGSTLNFGQLTVGMFPDDVVTYAKVQNAAALSVLGRSSDSAGDLADIAAANDGDVLRRSGTAVDFGSILSTSVSDFTESAQDAAAALIQNGTGITWIYNDGANTLTPTVSLAPFSTTNLAEGSNLYFTDERAQDAVGAALTDTSEIDLTYNDGAGTIAAALIASSIVYAKLQNVSATSRVLGRITAGAGVIEELTGANLATIIGTALGANPTASVGLTAVNGTAGTYLRSDAAPALDQGIAPTWTATHLWQDNAEVRLGTGADLRIYHDGTNNQIRADSGETRFTNAGTINFKFGLSTTAWTLWTNGSANTPVSFDDGGTLTQASVQNFGTAATSGSQIIARANASGNGGRLALMRNATNSQTNTALATNSGVGEVSFHGADGSVYATVARLKATSTAAFSGTEHGTKLELSNVANGSAAVPVVRLALIDTQVQVAPGTAPLPGLVGNTDPDTGFQWAGSNALYSCEGGAQSLRHTLANPSATIGLTAVNGTALTPMRSDAAPALDQGIAPTWTADHTSIDNAKVQLGTGADLQLFHDGTDSFIRSNTGQLKLQGSTTTVLALDTLGRLLIGPAATADTVGSLGQLQAQIAGTSSVGLAIARYSNNTTGPVFVLGKSRGASVGTYTAVTSGDSVTRWQFVGSDGTDFNNVAAQMDVTVDGAVSTNVVPGRYDFYTANSAGTLTLAMKINSSQQSLFADGALTTPGMSFHLDADTGLRRVGNNNQATVCGGTDIVDYSTTRVTFTVPAKAPTYTVAGLPSASGVGAGSLACVSDSNAAAGASIGTTVAGGGANFRPVYSDGTNWRLL